VAIVSPTFSKARSQDGGIDAVVITWTGIGNGSTGKPVKRPALADKTIQVEGTFGAGGSATLEGSNDSTIGTDGNFHALTDPQGNTIAIAAPGIKQVTEATLWIQPHVTAGDVTTSLNVTVVARRTLR
jgi:hypothetical protein